jgi:RHH-type transcriptional regulator, proline utilization regulon repressor / proline dehydrogenase / delta 1-pyrroline-5-carboxylate dehydrogenase
VIDRSIELARRLARRAEALQTPHEKRQQIELDRMMQHPTDRVALMQMTDRVFRSSAAPRAAEQLTHILDVQGIPRFFSPFDRALLRGFQSFGGYLPGVAVPLVKEKMQEETANVVLPAEPELLARHLRARHAEGIRMNLNVLGESLLGEDEAASRLTHYLEALADPNVEVISVKISTLYSQISALARAHTISILCDRIELLYRAATRARFVRADGTQVPKFVYLDMEEYRDLSLTVEVFMRTLSKEGLLQCAAGLALQAYIPDSFATQKTLTKFAMNRVAAGGAPITIRIVKGANMEMERLESALMGWPQAPFAEKMDTDANYKRMLEYALRPEHAKAVRIGIASHNLFELAYGLVLASDRGVMASVQFEMLEGMANHQRRALLETTRDFLLYAPACRRENFVSAIGYLVRRLDENTGPENFLRHAFRLQVESPAWQQLELSFRAAFTRVEMLPELSRRTQDRRLPRSVKTDPSSPFQNEPDTDWALVANGEWATQIYTDWHGRSGEGAGFAPLVIAGLEISEGRRVDAVGDPSRPGMVVSRHAVATTQDVEDAVACAKSDPDEWRELPSSSRANLLRQVADQLRMRRGDLMGVALAEAGKVLSETDPEVSEAIDFCELYARLAEQSGQLESVTATGRGVVAVVPPWNFPIAIPCGGIAAALAAGNTVIVKPAPATVLTAYHLCECFWEAGVSRRTLQFVFADNATGATQLVTHPGVDAVVFTGGTETARHLLSLKPEMHLVAETGGKNAIIVSAMSDRDLAIKHIVHSAFGHAGQKCSACSLVILEDEIYDDPHFKATLCDAVRSLVVGSAWEPQTRVGPLIRPPTAKLESALKELEPGESWAVLPRRLYDNPNLWSPGVKWGVSPGSVTHQTEFFGPVLGVMRAKNLETAVAIANATGYGLTSGLHSLDEREQSIWSESIHAGNLYINRGITGAIVMRQPFGGFGKSAFGVGIKAGGPNTLVPLQIHCDAGLPRLAEMVDDDEVGGLFSGLLLSGAIDEETSSRLDTALRSYTLQMRDEFSIQHDTVQIPGQDNFRRYLPAGSVRIRVVPLDTRFENVARICAAKLAGCRTVVSVHPEVDGAFVETLYELTESWGGAIEFLEEDDGELVEKIERGQMDRIRYAGADRVASTVRIAASGRGIHVSSTAILCEGRIELLAYLREQSISVDYHRYGNLGARSRERLGQPTTSSTNWAKRFPES